MKTASFLVLAAASLVMSGCKPKSESAATISLDSYFTDTAPAAPQAIHLVRTTAKPGDTVVVSGLIMGRKNGLFVEDRAAFMLGDPAVITPCNAKPGDGCSTPWDTCCNTKEDKQRATATIQFMGADGRVLAKGLKGEHGLTELSAVTLTGTVDKASTPEALIINATKLHVAKP